MKRIVLTLGILFICYSSTLSQITFRVTSLPENTPEDASIYIAGSFNGWDQGGEAYRLSEDANGIHFIDLSISPGDLAFKFTRGSWPTVEGNAAGGFQPNHEFSYTGGVDTVDTEILSWEDLGGSGLDSVELTAENVIIYDYAFNMPQLDRDRRIWIYLPPDYESSSKNYPVLYMHDGQNLFEESTSFAGEWQIDESLNQLFEAGDYGIIVVGIDNGGAFRSDEYLPWPVEFGGGQGPDYMNFIVETLKPHIDSNFRTLPDRENTGIMGSSFGGVISMYGLIEHQDVFSKAGVFSPSFWVTENCYTHVAETGKQADIKVYFIAGELESATLLEEVEAMVSTLQSAGFDASEIFSISHPDGQHNEAYWAREFPAAYQWLFSDRPTSSSTIGTEQPKVKLSPNPASQYLEIQWPATWKSPSFQIHSLTGQMIRSHSSLITTSIPVSDLRPGVYCIRFFEGGEFVMAERFIISR